MPPKNQKKNTVKSPVAATPSVQTGGVTNYDDIQSNEVLVMESMYPDEFQLVEKAAGAWNAKVAHCFKLNLKAETDSEVGITLNVEFPSVYPKVAPVIRLSDPVGLRAEHQKSLENLIRKQIADCMGDEMMSVIAEEVRQYLNNRANAKDADAHKPALFEERALKEEAERKRQAEEAVQAEKERKADTERRAEAERQRTKKAFNQAQQKRRVRLEAQSSQTLEDDAADTGDGICRLFPERLVVKDTIGNHGRFRKVGGMVLLQKHGRTSVYAVRPIFEVPQDFDVTLVLKEMEWTNQHPSSSEGTQILTKLETDLAKLIPSEDNQRYSSVVEVLATNITEIPIDYADDDHEDARKFRIDILMEYANKGSLADLLETVGKLNVSIVRSYVLQLIGGLRDLHQAGIVHRRIHAKNVLLFQSVGGKTIVKLADPGISYRLQALENYQDGTKEPLDGKEPWTAPELATSSVPTKKTDIWDFAVLILQMLHGLDLHTKHNSPQAALKEKLPSTLKDFLAKMFIREPNKRLGVFDLLPMEFLRQGDDAYDDDPTDNETIPTAISPVKRRGSFSGRAGRYAQEWDEIQRLGRGGFGEVVKARNKFDGNFYAVKKVIETSSNTLTDVLKEVLLLSQLNHPNVVRYYSTWIETSDRSTFQGVDSTSGEEGYSLTDNGSYSTSLDEGRRSHLDYISLKNDGIEFGYSSEGSDNGVFESDSDDDDHTSGDDTASEGVIGHVENDENNDEQSHLQIRETNRMQTGDKPDEISSEDEDSGSGTKKSVPGRPQIPVILYIQMEFCDKQTLRDSVNKDLYLRPDDYWQLLRQILNGLDYIHKKGIIHRDLKPENIFLSQTNMPRIGDFGLAASVGNHRPKSSHTQAAPTKTEDGNESVMTTQIGTRLYMAPEVLDKSNPHYTAKVDMYSLGIIFFEMCSKPASTSFELQEYITGLKSKEIIIPSCLNPEVKAEEVHIIRQLLRKASERPDAAELLTNHSIPLRINDDNFNQVIESLDDPSTRETRKAIILKKLFSVPHRPANDPFFDKKPVQGSAVDKLLMDMHVKETILSVFRRHGAVEVTKTFLVPDSQYYEEEEAMRLITERGDLVQLRYDQVLPYARQLATQEQNYTKSYSFGVVFRENGHGFGQPSSYGEVVFDIISKGRDTDLKEAETIKVMDEIIDSFTFFRGAKMEFNINHLDVLRLIFDFCGIAQSARRTLLAELSKLNMGEKWDTILRDLKAGKVISTASIAELKRFDWREQDFEKGFKRLRNITSNCKTFPSCSKAFDHLRNVFDYLKKFGVKKKVYFTPLNIYDHQYYHGGLVYTCSSDGTQMVRQTIASGGRYDDLIKASRPISTPADVGKIHAVGFKLSFDALTRGILKHHSRANKTKKKRYPLDEDNTILTRRCDVIVTASSIEDLKTYGIRITASLWAGNIRAELDDDILSGAGTSKSHLDLYGWQIIIKSNIAVHQTVKVRNLKTGDETDQLLTSLVNHINTELGEGKKDGMIEMLKARRLSSNQDLLPSLRHFHYKANTSGGGGGSPNSSPFDEGEILVIWPTERKGAKKPNRPQVMENARRKIAELGGKAVPVIAIDVYNEVLEAIRLSQLQGLDGWKKVFQTATSGPDKQYLQEVQQRIVGFTHKTRKEPGSYCYIYNYRTDACIFYYLS
ncbi:uncharacterized protein DFL_002268 [Arthrobotrys flagrans]|uniref:non-specific serine/threonine protein kinase n=1 Tax=Arthrobotrys flagrans TaxID=97331 RepID=A0A437AB06_ARTFL|nr:hypothetical protein DFL_002268 [Arthrobotrys flagrans]